MAFLDFLLNKGAISSSVADDVRMRVETKGEQMDSALAAHGMNPDTMLGLRSEYAGIPLRAVEEKDVSFKVLEYAPEESALHYKFIPLAVEKGILEIGIVDPDNIGARDAIQFIASKLDIPYKLFLISESDFTETAKKYKGLSGEVNKALSELETELDGDDETVASLEAKSDDISQTQIIEDAPVTKIVAVILRHAIEGNASDVHIEPLEDKVRVRFRVDGLMHTSLVLPAKVQSAVVARIKILTTSMKLDEKRKPQDGRFSAHIEGRKVDFRVSTFPTYYGEKVVMRILDTGKGALKLEQLGMRQEDIAIVREMLDRPYGIILLTGPTGSGKTTTLYSMLSEVDRDKKNVVSLEDPVEYNMPGVSQSQVRPEIDYTFANGLRSILRQDPDIIMVGEIRDKETAQLAIQAALTGHLVFSTIHTNTASGVIPRLIDMGVDPFLIAPTLALAIGQRLVPAICKGAKKERLIEGGIREMISQQIKDLPAERQMLFSEKTFVHDAVPTADCPSGTRGRLGVFELLRVDRSVEEVILTKPVEEEVYKAARIQGMLTMKEDALLKSFDGSVSFEEVNML
ncbi:MAG: type II/IV secretion system protein [Candidatus Yonathbacteria bacterium]|nr:type II/IV secretion system protein [Candidatus Yonathbacteria bacterium]NTW47459.1 type II/IV secretion system protein [Candidatus Yonathbacteria bacterium]